MAQVAVDKEAIAGFYDQRYEGDYMEDNESLEVLRVNSVLMRVPGGVKSILDYGCGQGRWLPVLARVFQEARITGVDISSKAVEKAQRRFPGHNLQVFDGEQTPFEEGSFDLIFSYHVLEHVSIVEKTVADMSRLLSEGGHIVVIFPCGNTNSFEEKIVRIIRDGMERTKADEVRFYFEDAGHLRRMSSREIIGRFNHYGIRVVEQFFANQFWGAMEWISKSGTAFVRHFFDYRKGITFLASLKLFFLQMVFLPLATIRLVASINFLESFQNSRRPTKKIVILLVGPFKPLARLVDKVLNILALAEWKMRKKSQNGSAQFLIFQKETFARGMIKTPRTSFLNNG